MSGINPVNPTLGFPCPLTLTCSVTGDTVVYSDPEYIRGRIEKAGSLEILLRTYVSKAGKRQQNLTKPESRPSRMWQGKAILPQAETVVTDEVHQSMHNHPANRVNQQPTEVGIVHRLYLGDDGISLVTHPRQHPEQKTFNLHDHRRNKADVHWTSKDKYYARFFA